MCIVVIFVVYTSQQGLKKVGTFLAKAGKEAYAGYTNGLLGLTKLDAAKKLASLAGFTSAFGGEVAVQFTIVKPNGKGWEIDGPNSGISVKLYTTVSPNIYIYIYISNLITFIL